MTTAKKLQQAALQVVHTAVSAIKAPVTAGDPIRVHEAGFDGDKGQWFEIMAYRESQHDHYVFRKAFWRDELEEWCWERFEFGELSFRDWWNNESWADQQAICEAFLESRKIGPELDEHYAAWLKESN